MRLTTFLVGSILFLTGVAFIHWYWAAICLGVFLVYASYYMSDPAPKSRNNNPPVSKPDFNVN